MPVVEVVPQMQQAPAAAPIVIEDEEMSDAVAMPHPQQAQVRLSFNRPSIVYMCSVFLLSQYVVYATINTNISSLIYFSKSHHIHNECSRYLSCFYCSCLVCVFFSRIPVLSLPFAMC
jgi:hypothetical protein